MQTKKIVLGLSGGVDSAVSAYLLKQRGYDVSCVYLLCYHDPGCRADQDRKDALKVALQLDLPFQVIDLRKEYKDKVLDYFYSEYKAGRTPNPDILCNTEIKFGLFYKWAIENNFDYIATGHYAKINKLKASEELALYTPKDLKKDQTYFIYQLKQHQLEHILFPLGDLKKTEVRKLATDLELHIAQKKDSMGICFVGDVDVKSMLIQKYGKKTGEVQLSNGTIIGEHDGYWLFTIGQRSNFHIKSKQKELEIMGKLYKFSNLPKLYVINIIPKDNIIVVGLREQTYRDQFDIKNLHLINKNYKSNLAAENIYIKIRNTGDMRKASIKTLIKNKYQINLQDKEFGISPGQHCIIYQNISVNKFIVLGGGVISS